LDTPGSLMPGKRSREDAAVPRVHFADPERSWRQVYAEFQVVLIEGCATAEAHARWDESALSALYASAKGRKAVDKNFCLEQADAGRRSALSADAVLSERRPKGNWYATFILQHDQVSRAA
jgi:hypothetical protein